jgi:RNA polymerase sigma-70 factor (ECF subfamily)
MGENRESRERTLSERLHSGDMTALEEVYDLFATAIYRQALAVVSAPSDAEDVLQEVFLKLIRRKGPPIQELKAYLMTAARNEGCSLLRRRRREVSGSDEEVVFPDPFVMHRTVGTREELCQAIQGLPPEQREVVILKVYEQMTFLEIARVVKASANTVASRYRYAMKRLRDLLGDPANV